MKQNWIGNVKRVVLPYLLVSTVWILASDRLAAMLLPEVSQLTQAQTVKGLLFVALSGGLIAWLLQREQRHQARTFQELVESQRRYQQAVLNSPDPIFSINAEGIIQSCNDACVALFGYKQKLVGRHYETILANPEASRTASVYVERVLAEGVTLTGVGLSFRTGDGGQREMVARLYPVIGPDGRVEECVFANSDVTSRRRAEERLRFQAKLLDNVREAVLAVDLEGTIIYWGAGAEALYGYPAEASLGRHITTLFPEAIAQQLMEHPATQPDGALWSGQIGQQRQDGTLFWSEATLAQVSDEDGRVTGYIGIARDITKRHQAEVQTHQRNRDLALLNRVIGGANSGLRPDEVLALACRELAQTFDVPRVTSTLAMPDGQVFRFASDYTAGTERTGLDFELHADQTQVIRLLLEHRAPLIIEDARRDPRLSDVQPVIERQRTRSLLIVPLLLRDEVLGALVLSSTDRRSFTREEAELATSVAGAVAQALHNARLYEELQTSNERLLDTVANRTTELQQVKNRVEAILGSSPDVIMLLSGPDRIETANRAFATLFQQSADPYGTSLPQLFEAADRPKLEQALDAVLNQGTVTRLELTACRSDGSSFDAELALAPVDGQQKPMIVATLRDISVLKEVERLKDDFVSNVSHELRTPITSMKVYHELLKHDTHKREIYMQRLQREIDRLAAIIESLLTLSRIDQDRLRLQFQPVDVTGLLGEYAGDRWPLADRKDLTLALEEGPELPAVLADRVMLGQVLSIILTNAFNYTPPGGSVCLTPQIRTNEQGQPGWVGFSVADTGVGIPPDELPSLFTRFFRGSAGIESGAAGTGLGLAIAAEIVQAHGGSIEVTSSGQPGKGACFTVWLPVAEVAVE